MSTFMINTGNLNKRIDIQRLSVTTVNGFEVQKWNTYKTVWASVENNYATETAKFSIRYMSELNETMRILFQGKQYSILFIDDMKYQHRYMVIKAEEVKA